MSIHEQLSLSKPDVIGHPEQAGWLEDGLNIMQGEPRDTLERRLGGSYAESDLGQLLKCIGDVSLSLDAARQTHEKDSFYKLQLAGDAIPKDRQDAYEAELAKYGTFIGNSSLIGEQIRWFADVATTAFANLDTLRTSRPRLFKWLACDRDGVAKVGLDLGGVRLAGIWDGVEDLDKLASKIPKAVEEVAPDAVILSRGEFKNEVGYTFAPVRATEPMEQPSIGTVRQRSVENIVRIPGSREALVIKELSSIILLDALRNAGPRNAADRRRMLLRESEEVAQGNYQENSPVAQAAGRVFARAILRRKAPRWVVPLSAHLYVLTAADRPIVPEA